MAEIITRVGAEEPDDDDITKKNDLETTVNNNAMELLQERLKVKPNLGGGDPERPLIPDNAGTGTN